MVYHCRKISLLPDNDYEPDTDKDHHVRIYETIARELSISPEQVKAVADLLHEGATIPFIARYRKEAHGSLDEVAVGAIRDRLEQLHELDARRQAVLKSLEERELLTGELRDKIESAGSLAVLEDIYLPYRPKRRTRATMAREKGLEPLAQLLLEQRPGLAPEDAAQAYIDLDKGVESTEAALAGARDIIAETVSEDATARAALRDFFSRKAAVSSSVSKGKEEEGAKFRDYFDWSEPASKAAGHRLLAMLRGEAEGILTLHFLPEAEPALDLLRGVFVKNGSPAGQQVREAVEDGYKRLLAPSLETELRGTVREAAENEAIGVFARNLRQLLLASPFGQKRVLAIDPGFRTGCKIVCLDAQGALLHHDLIYVMSPEQQKSAGEKIRALAKTYDAEAIAIGNGTAGRETESLVRSLQLPIPVIVVSESGASVYSASETARKEFPDLDLTVRGAISIGRRLMDPLAELVKIDPKAIGVGQYQHDVDQTALKKSLTDVVESCVNAVGVELNTASAELLTHVSGLGPALAKAVVTYREANGPFSRRKDVLKVPRLGPKAFELAAGFLRIHGGANPLDGSAVHPESYGIVEGMAKNLGCKVSDLLADPARRRQIDVGQYVTETVGLPTLKDILAELEKPGRDPREAFEAFAFAEGVSSIGDLEPGMRLPGIVTNVTNFGAFVDIGVHQDGLVHISQMADHFVSDPHTVLKVQQKVTVTVLEVDAARKRIALSLRADPQASQPREQGTPSRNKDAARGGKSGGERKTQGHSGASGDRETGHRPFQDMLSRFKKQ